jgi:hypothetical protein
MYRNFFALRANPFNASPDSRYLFLTRRNKEVLACLAYFEPRPVAEIHQSHPFVILPTGCGFFGSADTRRQTS